MALFSFSHLGLSNGLLTSGTFPLAVERILYLVDSESSERRMRDFVGEIVADSADLRRNLMYFAAHPYDENEYQAKLQDEVLELLVKHETDPGQQDRLLEGLAAGCLDRPDLIRFFLSLSELMDVTQFHNSMVVAAFQHKYFAVISLQGGRYRER